MKVRCSYCKAQFTFEPGARGQCPQCGRVALLRSAKKPKFRRSDRQEDSTSTRPALVGMFFAGLGPVRRVVLAIGIVASVFGLVSLRTPSLGTGTTAAPGKTKHDRALRELQAIDIGICRFTSDCGHSPTEEEGLLSLLNNPGYFGWKGPYVVPFLRPDPWDHWYAYHVTDSNTWTVSSWGPDGIDGTADDVKLEDPRDAIDRGGVTPAPTQSPQTNY